MTETTNYYERVLFFDDLRVMEVDFSNFTFQDSETVDAFYDVIESRIAETGKKWYFLVNYKNCQILPEAWVAFANRGKKVNLAYSLGTVRFDAQEDTGATILEKSKTDEFDPNLFRSRDGALAQIAAWRDAVETSR